MTFKYVKQRLKKYIPYIPVVIVTCLMILAGYGVHSILWPFPRFQVGDCLASINMDYEEWVTPSILPYQQVVGIGKKHYHLKYLRFNDTVDLAFSDFQYVNDTKQKVPCQ